MGCWSGGVLRFSINTPLLQYSNEEVHMAIKEITPQQAYDTLQSDAEVVYIDVRTEGEFVAGHPKGAINIPVAFHDPARGMVMNPEFNRVVEQHFSKERKIIVGCQAGP